MWRYKILQFKERHLVVICQTFAQSLRGSRGSSDLSFMSFGRSLRRYAAFPVWKKSAGSCYLITWVKFGISKFFYQLFVRRVHRWCVQSLVPICETAWEEFEKVGLWQFANLQNKTEGRGLYDEIEHNSVNRWICVFECAIKYMGVMRQKVLDLIIAPPSGENSWP